MYIIHVNSYFKEYITIYKAIICSCSRTYFNGPS